MSWRKLVIAVAVAAPVAIAASSAQAQDAFKIAIGQLEIWSGQAPILGQKAGIFKKQGIMLENFGTAGAGETVQAVISGSADFGVNVGLSGVLRAFAKGAPIRVIGANFTGAGDIYFYVRTNSPIKSLKDTTEKTHHLVFDQRLDDPYHRPRSRQGARHQGGADSDRRHAGDLDGGDVGADRHRLGSAAVRPQGDRTRARSA